MKRTISLLGEKVIIDVDHRDFYETMLEAIVERVFQLLGPKFDKRAFLEEVENDRVAVEVGQELAIPVSILLSLELGYCLGQLKGLGRIIDSHKALEDLYGMWKSRLKIMLREEMISRGPMH